MNLKITLKRVPVDLACILNSPVNIVTTLSFIIVVNGKNVFGPLREVTVQLQYKVSTRRN